MTSPLEKVLNVREKKSDFIRLSAELGRIVMG